MTERQILSTIKELSETYYDQTKDNFYKRLGTMVKKKLKQPEYQ